jgi:hypothetical protein
VIVAFDDVIPVDVTPVITGGLLTVMVTLAVDWVPALLLAMAARVWLPLAAAMVFHVVL